MKRAISFDMGNYHMSMTDIYPSRSIYDTNELCYCLDFTIDIPNANCDNDRFGENLDIQDHGNYGKFILSAQSKGKEIFRIEPEIHSPSWVESTEDDYVEGRSYNTAVLIDTSEHKKDTLNYDTPIEWTSPDYDTVFRQSWELLSEGERYPSLGELCKQFEIDSFQVIFIKLYENTYEDVFETDNAEVADRYKKEGAIVLTNGGASTITFTVYASPSTKTIYGMDNNYTDNRSVENEYSNSTIKVKYTNLINPYYWDISLAQLLPSQYYNDKNIYLFSIE